jgi:hypothetical protein
MIPQRGLLGNKTWRETQIDLEVYELNVDLILTVKRFSPIGIMRCTASCQLPHSNQDLGVALACPQAPKSGRECFLLLRSRELGDQQRVADGDLVFQECFGHGRNEVSEPNATVLCCPFAYATDTYFQRTGWRRRAKLSQHN